MKTNRLFWVLLIFLVLTNIMTIGMLWDRGRKGPPPPISELLELTGQKKQKADEIEKKHHRDKRKLIKKSEELRRSFYLQVFSEKNHQDSLSNLINQNDQMINQMTFDFFEDISNLCNPSQKEELKERLKKFNKKRKK